MLIQQTSFDFNMPPATGEQLRDLGIQKAVNHADSISPNWSQDALNLIKRFIQQWPADEFMTEDIRAYAEKEKGFVAPLSLRAWGGPICKAKNEGLIEAIGTKQVKNPKAHMANATVWRIVNNNN